MTFRKKIATALVALSAVSVLGVTAAATVVNPGYSEFVETVYAGASAKKTEAVKKLDDLYAVVYVKDGTYDDYITFRVRTADGSDYASEYVDAYTLNKKYYMDYLSGYGYAQNYYRLGVSYDAGQWRSSTTVSGEWIP